MWGRHFCLPVLRTFLSGLFGTGDWKVARTRRQECLRYIRHCETYGLVTLKNLPDLDDVAFAGRFVERDAQRMAVNFAEIHPVRFGSFENVRCRLLAEFDADRVKKRAASILLAVLTF